MGSRGARRPSFANNKRSTSMLYNERKYYKRNILTKERHRNTIDMWDDRYSRFGKVNLQNQPIRLDPSYISEVRSTSDKDTSFYLINFVADAFVDFREYMRGATEAATGMIAFPKSSKFHKMDIHNSNIWFGSDEAYRAHLQNVFEPFVTEYLDIPQYARRVKNISNFVDMWFQMCKELGQSIPLTKTGFMESRYTPTANLNGYMIEIAKKQRHDNDLVKDSWIEDPGFNYYIKGAAYHGFLVDRNAPWRLVANLESRTMSQYMSKYNIKSMSQLFDEYYVKTYLDDIRQIKEIMFAFYSYYLRLDPSYEKVEWCAEGQKVMTSTVFRQPSHKESFFIKYGDRFWMRIWFLMRVAELDIKIYDKKINALLTTSYKIQKTLDLSSAMDYLNNSLFKLSGRPSPPTKAFIERETDRQLIIKK
tara:strand:+ start:3514 stop:4773 length:1260 start_codon:yes stop_codon:yes gene_type:complete